MHRIGKYKITVIATNGLKDGEVEASIAGYMYVSNVPHCYPPGVTILGVDTNRVSLNYCVTTACPCHSVT